jgi:hypothetical protein
MEEQYEALVELAAWDTPLFCQSIDFKGVRCKVFKTKEFASKYSHLTQQNQAVTGGLFRKVFNLNNLVWTASA